MLTAGNVFSGPSMTDLRDFIAELRAWCHARGLSPRYVTKEACENSRLVGQMERQASRYERKLLQLRRWMEAYDRNREDLDRERARKRRKR